MVVNSNIFQKIYWLEERSVFYIPPQNNHSALHWQGIKMKIQHFFDIKFLKFVLVGIVNTLMGSAIMFLLYNVAHFSYWLSSAFAYVFIGILSFILNKYFTFAVKQWSAFMVVAFIVNIAVCYLMAYGIARPVVNVLLQDSRQTVRENIALFTGMCLFTILNYLGQRFVVFKRRNGDSV
jgi:putative flippase GtrA